MTYASSRKPVLGLLLLALVTDSSATRAVPPTISEVVNGSDHIGLVEVLRAEVYRAADEEGEIQCGVLYQGNWIDTLSGDSGQVAFASRDVLEVDTVYLVFLAEKPLARKLMSTNSLSEGQREKRLAREDRLCIRSQHLPRTIFRSARFLNEQNIADSLRTGTWVEDPAFSESPLEVITIFPTELSIADQRIPRDLFIDQFYSEGKHQVVRTAGWSLIVFRAVAWQEYCSRLAELASNKFGARNLPSTGTFCAQRTWVDSARW